MKTSSLVLIPATQFGTPSENYNGTDTDFNGIPQKAAAYYSKGKDLQTVSWFLLNFLGTMTIEATLDTDAEFGNYFPVSTTIGDGITPVTNNGAANISGNFTWIRIVVTDFTDGNITKITLSY